MTKKSTICYFGIYNPTFSRNRIYVRGLQELGVEVLECRDTSSSLMKFWRLWRKHRKLPKYDALVVGYPGHLVVPFAKLVSHTPVIADLLGSLADAEEHSHSPSILRKLKSKIIDWFAVTFADIVLLESEAQRNYFIARFGKSQKYQVLYTGADGSVFHCEWQAKKDVFLVLFRGSLTPESGILVILEAARLLLEERQIKFRVIGTGPLLSEARAMIQDLKLLNVELIDERLSEELLRKSMCEASLALGQFADNPRVSRTIPHKAFEALALGIPYLSGDARAIREIIIDSETGFFVPLKNPEALAQKVRELSNDPARLFHVAENAKRDFNRRFAPCPLARELMQIITVVR